MVTVVQLVERQIVILVVVGSSPIGHPIHYLSSIIDILARVAELVDALVLGTSILDVRVRVSPFAPYL